MTNIRVFKYPDRTYVEVKFDFSKELWAYIKERGFKRKSNGYHFKSYYKDNPEAQVKYKQDMKILLKDVKYKRIEYFKFMKKVSNVEKFLENLGVEL